MGEAADAGYSDGNEGESPPAAHGTADDGFGDSEVDVYYYTPLVSRESSGVRYSVREGGPQVAVTCSPSASASVDEDADSWSCGVDYSVNVFPITIDISGGLDPTDTNAFLIGQKVTAKLNTNGAPSLPTDTFSWTVSGANPFDNFIASNASGHYYPLWSLNPNNTRSVACYFAKQGSATFTCRANLAGQSVTIDAEVSLEKPEWSRVTSIGTVMDVPQPNPTYVQLIEDSTYAGSTPSGAVHGVDWNGTSVTTPEDYYEHTSDAGLWGWHQLWKPYRPITFFDGTTENLQSSTAGVLLGQEVADTGYPYFNEWYIADGSDGGDSDSPFSALLSPASVSGVHVDETFRDFLMYVPPGGDTVAVPLVEIGWSWHFDASSNRNTWTVSNKGAQLGSPTDFPDFPSWASYTGASSLYY